MIGTFKNMIYTDDIENYLKKRGNLEISFYCGDGYKIFISPYQNHFKLTVYQNGLQISQMEYKCFYEVFQEWIALSKKYLNECSNDK